MSAVLIDSKALASVPRKRLPANLLSDYARRVEAGVFGNQKEKIDFVARFRTVLAEEEADWKRLQVSMVAGAATGLWSGDVHSCPYNQFYINGLT